MKQILINILRNSTKFTFKGYIQISARPAKIKASVRKNIVAVLDSVQFEIYDTGIGISRENLSSMFKLFGKVLQKNKSVNKEGIGLGLYITKNLVSELSGLISIDSIESSFTKFTITLPVSRQLIFSKEHLDMLEEM